jgi:PhnB protein
MTPKTKPKPIPDAYRRVTPCLIVRGGVKALEFYGRVFDATERMRFSGPTGRSPTLRSRSGIRS